MKNITINYDFKTGKELSYAEALLCTADFETNCISLFNNFADNITVISKDGKYINNQELLLNDGRYTPKEIRYEHNIYKLLVSGAFVWEDVKCDTSWSDKKNILEDINYFEKFLEPEYTISEIRQKLSNKIESRMLNEVMRILGEDQ